MLLPRRPLRATTLLLSALLALGPVLATAQAKIEPVQSIHPGLMDMAAQQTPPAEQAPSPASERGQPGGGNTGFGGAVALVVVLALLAGAAWWWPRFQRKRNRPTRPVPPAKGPTQADRPPDQRGH